jgi:hypothetical protein
MVFEATVGVLLLSTAVCAAGWWRTRRRLGDSQREQRALERSSRVLEEERHVLELVAKGASLQQVLDSLTSAIQRIEPDCLCSILLLDEEGKHLFLGAAPSLPEGFK